MRMRITLALGTVGLVSLGLLAPAQAAGSDCTGGYVCVYDDANYGGCNYRWEGNDGNYSDNTAAPSSQCYGSINDRVSSIDNDGYQCGTGHYHDANQQGLIVYLARGDYVQGFAAWSTNNDSASSHEWC